MKKFTAKTSLASADRKPAYAAIAAGIVYACFAGYLYYPYLNRDKAFQILLLTNSIFAAVGCFVLSRRWTTSFGARLFAGAVYGFGPFALSIAAFHPLAGMPFAVLPWLFLPAIYWKGSRRNTFVSTILTALLCVLPFAVVGAFFWLCAQPMIGPFFPLPQQSLTIPGLTGLLAAMSRSPHEFIFGFYHVPLTVGIIGLAMYFKANRFGLLVIAVAGLTLSFCPSVIQVPPVIWASFCILACSVIIGLGIQVLISCGKSDCKWVLAGMALASVLAIASFLTGFSHAAKMHALSIGLFALIAAIAGMKKRWHLLRWVILCSILGIDLLTTSAQIVDKIF